MRFPGHRDAKHSSLSRNAQYGRRVAYEVLRGYSPRLDRPVGPDDPDADEAASVAGPGGA